jgi:PAS domain-containing protein
LRRTAAGHETAQQAADLQTQRLAEVIAHLPIAYLLTTPDAIIQQANPAAAAMLNLSARALLGRNLLLFVDERVEWMRMIGTVRADGSSLRHLAMIHPRERMAQRMEAIVTPSAGPEPALHWMLTKPAIGPLDASAFHNAPLVTCGTQ